ncbi:MAG: hypothetical protein MPN21_14705 [Thermoanaerobaculia bacterium]|nr:hypothetical protein [Thermoanaerobaculia bacterium]
MKSLLSRHPIISTVCMLGLLLYVFFLVATYSSESVGPTPTLLYPAVPLGEAVSVEKISWSPSGAFILIETEDGSRSGYPKVGPVVVLDLANRSVVARIEGAQHAWWGADDSIWVWTDDNWNVYASPFHSPVPWDSGYGEQPYRFDLNTRSERLAVAEFVDVSENWAITVFENAKESFAVRLTPKYRNPYPTGSMRSPSLTFSPSGRFLAVVISGWVGHESSGPQELWMVDVKEQRLSHVHTGKYKWWQIADADTQSLHPSWTASEDAVIYGDITYGIEELSIPDAKSRTIIGRGPEVYKVLVSPTGRWIAFERWPEEDENVDRYDRWLGVVSRNGRKILHLPVSSISWPDMYKDWHPKKDVLAVLKRNDGQETHDLYTWDLAGED